MDSISFKSCKEKLICFLGIIVLLITATQAIQINIPRVELMPNIPNHYVMRDWKQVAKDYDALTFNFNTTGQYLPLIWWDSTYINYPRVTFGQPSYVGSQYTTGNAHESINTIGEVIGASLVGIDKSNQNGYNFALMEQNYYNKANGQDLVLDDIGGVAGGSFWYDILPGILFTQLVSFYPSVDNDSSGTISIVSTMAEKWFFASIDMADSTGFPNYNHTAFDFQTHSPVDNGLWTEPDASAGIAWLEYMAYVRSGKTQSDAITAADWGMRYLQNRTTDPLYDTLLPYGAYISARMNAEQGGDYDVGKIINWCITSTSSVNTDYGVVAGNWGGYDVYGLVGGNTNGGGYAFAMETYLMSSNLVPLVRYDDRFARAIGKWSLNATSACQYFYANALDSAHQSCASWQYQYDTSNCLSYEGFRNFGRVCDRIVADYSNLTGIVVSGTYGSTSVYLTDGLYEVLEESTGSQHALNHIWQINLTLGCSNRVLYEYGYITNGGNNNGFVFSYATTTSGPWTTIFTVTNTSLNWGGYNYIPANISGPVYIRVTNSGTSVADSLYVDMICVLSDLTTTPYSMGDALSGLPAGTNTDIGLYGGAHVGILGSIISTTNITGILQLNCLATDYYHDTAYPTYLYYNPYEVATTVQIDVGSNTKDLYEVTDHTFLETGVSGLTSFPIPADSAVLLVVAPAGGVQSQNGKKLLIDDVIVDYNAFPLDITDWRRY